MTGKGILQPRSIALNTLVQIAGKGIFGLCGLFLVGYLARALGAQGFGACTSLFAWMSTLIIVADMGLYLTGVRRLSPVSSQKEKTASLLGSLLTARLFLAGLVMAGAWLVLWVIPYDLNIKLLIAVSLPSLLLLSAARAVKSWFQARLIMHCAVIAEIAGCLCMVAITVGTVQSGGMSVLGGPEIPPEIGVALGLLAGSGAFLAIHVLLAHFGGVLGIRTEPRAVRGWIVEAFPLGLSAILAALYLRFDMLMLSWMKPAADVGVYGLAFTIVEVTAVAPALFLGSMLSVFSKALAAFSFSAAGPKPAEQRSDLTRRPLHFYYQRSFWFLALFAVPGLVFCLFLAQPIMVTIAGHGFFQGPGLSGETLVHSPFLAFQILAWVAFLMVWGQLNGHLLVAAGQQKIILRIYFFLVPVNICLNFALIPKYSYLGAAWATLICEIAALSISSVIVWRMFHLFPRFRT